MLNEEKIDVVPGSMIYGDFRKGRVRAWGLIGWRCYFSWVGMDSLGRWHLSTGLSRVREGPSALQGTGSLTAVGASDWGGTERNRGRSADPKWCLVGTSSSIFESTLIWILAPSSTLPLFSKHVGLEHSVSGEEHGAWHWESRAGSPAQ